MAFEENIRQDETNKKYFEEMNWLYFVPQTDHQSMRYVKLRKT